MNINHWLVVIVTVMQLLSFFLDGALYGFKKVEIWSRLSIILFFNATLLTATDFWVLS